MSDLNTNSEQLSVLDDTIDKARDALSDAQDALGDADYSLTIKRETVIFKAKYEEKLSDITAKAKAVVECAVELRAYMTADSKNKRARIALDKAIDRKTTLMEQNYNIRAQMKVFGN
jgi:hypothetical protein